jgi:predicted translin family RNA/ssDNA-binding protein
MSKKIFDSILKDLKLYYQERGILHKISSEGLTKSKQAIFTAHDGEIVKAEKILKEVRGLLTDLNKKYNHSNRLQFEGSYRACVEEFLEATFFVATLKGKELKLDPDFHFGPEEYIGGLCDLTGELVRQAVLLGSKKNLPKIKKYTKITKEVVGFMMQLYISGKSRQKFDEAKRNLKRLEQIVYEINLKNIK